VCPHSCHTYPAYKSHLFCNALCCHLWPTRLTVPYFSTLSHKRHDFGKYVTDIKWVFTTFAEKISHSKNNSARYNKFTYVFISTTPSSCQILTKIECSRQFFEKILKYQIWWKSVQWKSSCFIWTDRQAEWHDDANSRFSQFCDRV